MAMYAKLEIRPTSYSVQKEAIDAIKKACKEKGITIKHETTEGDRVFFQNEHGGVIATVVASSI